MTPIIAGRFDQQKLADQAVVALLRRGFAVEDVTAFSVGHSASASAAASSVRAQPTAQEGAGITGSATGQPRTVYRAFAADEARAAARAAGILVAARAPDYPKRVVAVNVLETMGAQDVERAQGTWEQGRWVDFDPQIPPRRVDLPPPRRYAISG